MGVAFPAYAGMNRLRRWTCPIQRGVPRVCGDEPDVAEYRPADEVRSPRMRG